MHSLEEELRELAADGVIDGETAADELAIERREIFSLYAELRAASYAAVALIVAGVGMLVAQHLDHIGPLTLMLAIALVAAGCYLPALRARRQALARSTVAEYLLLLASLLLSADLGYGESQYHWFGAHWERHLLVLAVWHAAVAYAFASRIVLTVALTALAGWFGIEHSAGWVTGSGLPAPGMGLRATACAATVLLWRAIDGRANGARFAEVFEHFAANVAFWGALAWCSDPGDQLFGVPLLLALAAVALRRAISTQRETFAVYGIGYAALGLSIVLWHSTAGPTVPVAAAQLTLVLAAAAGLRLVHDRLRVTGT